MKIFGSIVMDGNDFGGMFRLPEEDAKSYIDKYLRGAMTYRIQGECPDEYIREIKKRKNKVQDSLVGLWTTDKRVKLIVVIDRDRHIDISIMFDSEKDRDDYLRSFMI